MTIMKPAASAHSLTMIASSAAIDKQRGNGVVVPQNGHKRGEIALHVYQVPSSAAARARAASRMERICIL